MLFKCNHKNKTIVERSNVVQLDDMGYPLRLCISKCDKCGQTKQEWIDSTLRDDDAILKWNR